MLTPKILIQKLQETTTKNVNSVLVSVGYGTEIIRINLSQQSDMNTRYFRPQKYHNIKLWQPAQLIRGISKHHPVLNKV